MLFPCLCVYLLTDFLRNENKKYYGVGVSHELNEPNFVSAFQWLTRLEGGTHPAYVPVSRAALNQAYEISAHFAMLKPFLSQQTEGRGWAKFGCEWMGICDELPGGWILWAVRDAAASIGVYQSATSASRFFGEVAREIKTACKEGRVRCTANPDREYAGAASGMEGFASNIPLLCQNDDSVVHFRKAVGGDSGCSAVTTTG